MAPIIKPTKQQAKDLLQDLHDNPVGVEVDSNRVLAPLWKYLEEDSVLPDGSSHWFCEQHGDPIVVQAATFLIRLYAYSSETVGTWRRRMAECLSRCPDCVHGLQLAKHSSKETYFNAFSTSTLNSFYASFNVWEAEYALQELAKIGISPDGISTHTLADAPPAVSYHLVENVKLLQDARMVSVIRACVPTEPIIGWPTDPAPPGLLVLMMDADPKVRRWAKAQCHKCTTVPIPNDTFVGPYLEAFQAVTDVLSSSSLTDALGPVGLRFTSLSTDPADLWMGFVGVLRLVPTERLSSSAHFNLDVRRVVTGHLHDTGQQFIDILQSLLVLLRRLGSILWKGEGPEYPQMVFDRIKDNCEFEEMVKKTGTSSDRPWFLAWFLEFLQSISDKAVFGDVLAKIVDFTCEELQHERFGDARPAAMLAAVRLLSSLLRTTLKSDNMSQHIPAVTRVVDVRSEILVNVAFSRSYEDPKWSQARTSAREFVRKAFEKDIADLINARRELCRNLAHVERSPEKLRAIGVPTVRAQLWRQTYAKLQSKDAEGMMLMITTMARSGHFDTLTKNAHTAGFTKQPKQTKFIGSSEPVFTAVNLGVDVIRQGFLDTTEKFTNYNDASAVQSLIQRPGVGKDVMILMLSPSENIQGAAQSLVGSAFDVDGRLDCFRALLENLRDESMAGIFEFLEIFVDFAPVVREACSLAKSLVRCFTDIIEVLCTRGEGLLHGLAFMKANDASKPAPDILKLWGLMTKSITVIFKRTPGWSGYFPAEDMVEWMRDALIFGRDLLAQRTVFENAVDGSVSETVKGKGKSGKALRVGKKMVESLQEVLESLLGWLRLTDEELLHQSFALLETMFDCFRENDVKPIPDSIARLNRYVDEGRKADRKQTRLDAGRLAKLELALSSFEEDDDEIQIISHTLKRASSPVEIVEVPRTEEKKKAKDLVKAQSKVKAQVVDIPRASTFKLKPGKLSAADRERLEAPSAFPSLRGIASSSKLVKRLPRHKDAGPKDEGRVRASAKADSSSDEKSTEEENEPIVFPKPKPPKPIMAKIPRMADKPRGIKLVPMQGGPGSIHPFQDRTNRRDDARRNAMRLKPDISALHRVVLSWNYEHTGDEPPNKPRLIHVPDRFETHDHYRTVFEPLLVMECWSQLVKSKEETSDTYECSIEGRQFSDQWLDIDITIGEDVRREWYLTETDVVLLKHADGKKTVLSKVKSYRAGPRGIQGSLRCFTGASTSDPGLVIGSSWRLTKVFSLSTLHREYAALMALPYYDLANGVLTPQLTKPMNDCAEVARTMKAFGLNEPQATAIVASLKTDGFGLIQGPPGTGKTSTIVGLIDAFLAKRPKAATVITAGRQAAPQDKGPIQKVLLCAPSNAAVDEVAARLMANSRGSEQRFVPKVVRIGTQKSMGTAVKSISLDYLVEQKMNVTSDSAQNPHNEMANLRQELENVKRTRQSKQEEADGIRDNGARVQNLEEDMRSLNSRRTAITQQLDRLRDKQKSDNRGMDASKRKFRAQVLNEADVICCTLSGAGHESLEQFDFEMVVIDEAAQAIELSSLIPLKYHCKRCIMVGDPQQLPPTVISGEASKFHYNQSLFVRLQKHRPDAVHLLSIQYRMHPEISRLPSRLFYQGRLQDGPDMATKTKQVWQTSPKFGIYRFFNVAQGRETHGGAGGHSALNKIECDVAVALFNRLRVEFSSIDWDGRVGVVSMYQAQVVELRRAFERRFGMDISDKVHFHTVDGFQGQEKDVIILSCVRAGPGVNSIGFLADTRRMNVAITRSKSSLFILGHAATLERSDANWKSIVGDARSRALLTDVDPNYFSSATNASARLPAVKKSSVLDLATLPEIPAGLSTPRELGRSSSKAADRSVSRDVKMANPNSVQLDQCSSKPTARPEDVEMSDLNAISLAPTVSAPRKRPREEDEPRAGPSGYISNPNPKPNKPRPTTKKPKTGPSLFIPKTNKRPPPPGPPKRS